MSFCIFQAKGTSKMKSHWFSMKHAHFVPIHCICKIHQEMNSTNNQLFLILSIILYIVVVCHFASVKQKAQKSKISLIFNEICSLWVYSLHTCKIHQEMNSTTKWLFLALSNIIYMLILWHFAFVKQKPQEKQNIIYFQSNMLILWCTFMA